MMPPTSYRQQWSWKIEKLSEFWFGEPLDGNCLAPACRPVTFHITALIARNLLSLLQKRENSRFRVWNKRNVLHPHHVALWSKHAPYFPQNCWWNVQNQNLGLVVHKQVPRWDSWLEPLIKPRWCMWRQSSPSRLLWETRDGSLRGFKLPRVHFPPECIAPKRHQPTLQNSRPRRPSGSFNWEYSSILLELHPYCY